MQYTLEIVIDDEAKVPRIVIHTAQLTDDVQRLSKLLQGNLDSRLLGYRDDDVVLLESKDIICFFTQGQTAQARTKQGLVRVKHRIYELEDMLTGSSFVRISNSEIVNFDKVSSFELSLNGTISLRTNDGETAYVSRRYVKTIKEYLRL